MNVPREKIIIMTPCIDTAPDATYTDGVLEAIVHGRVGNKFLLCGQSNIGHARNMLGNIFRRSNFEMVVMIDADIGFTLQDLDYLLEGNEPVAIGEYAAKAYPSDPARPHLTWPVGPPRPVKFGMGFCRIHRSVFEALDELRTDEGAERLQRYRENGEDNVEYFIDGACGDGRYVSEDRGFWSLVQITGVPIRIERRARVRHVGRHEYHYVPDDEGAN